MIVFNASSSPLSQVRQNLCLILRLFNFAHPSWNLDSWIFLFARKSTSFYLCLMPHLQFSMMHSKFSANSVFKNFYSMLRGLGEYPTFSFCHSCINRVLRTQFSSIRDFRIYSEEKSLPNSMMTMERVGNGGERECSVLRAVGPLQLSELSVVSSV